MPYSKYGYTVGIAKTKDEIAKLKKEAHDRGHRTRVEKLPNGQYEVRGYHPG